MKAISILLMSSLLTSCALIGPGGTNVPMNSAIIYGITKSATTLALETVYEDFEERMDAAGDLLVAMDTYVLPILSNPQALINAEAEKLLFKKIPEQYRFYLETALKALDNYYVSPKAEEVLSNEYVQYLRSFFSAIRQSASDMLHDNNRVIDINIKVRQADLTLPY